LDIFLFRNHPFRPKIKCHCCHTTPILQFSETFQNDYLMENDNLFIRNTGGVVLWSSSPPSEKRALVRIPPAFRIVGRHCNGALSNLNSSNCYCVCLSETNVKKVEVLMYIPTYIYAYKHTIIHTYTHTYLHTYLPRY
jgi:hypothetical protein